MAVCFAAGITLDRWLQPAWLIWLLLGLGLMSSWWMIRSRRRHRLAAGLLLAGCLCLGGARHHLFRSTAQPDDIALFASQQNQLVRLTGTLTTQPMIVSRKDEALRPAWPQVDKTVSILRCRSLKSQGGSIPVTGSARLTVTGHLLHADVGDEIEVVGWLWRPGGPDNPGGFDFQEYLNRQGIRCVVSAGHPDAIRRLRSGRWWRVHRWLAELRRQADFLFIQYLEPRRAKVASALLLGDRSEMTHDLRMSFAESGMMHLLAVSGLHVGVLAALAWIVCRLFNLSASSTPVLILTVVAAYVGLVLARPPVVRAAVFVFVAGLGRPWFRQPSLENTLAISALLILAWNPADLFDVGAQLSFLAVMGIICSNVFDMTGQPVRSAIDIVSLAGPPDRSRKWLERLGRVLKDGYVVVGAIWLFTLPLVMAQFHLVSPVGLLINVFLIPLVIGVLWSGYLFLGCGFLLPELAPLFGWIFDFGLACLLWIVDGAAEIDMAHLYLPGPPRWWLVGYYVLLGGLVWFRGSKQGRRRSWIALTAWTVAGLTVGLMPTKRDGLRCTFLAMGHGCSVLVELPQGRTLLYDAGSLKNGLRAQQIVQEALWERGCSRIDALVLSHSDVDHFNAVPGLLETVSVGGLYVPVQFRDSEEQTVAELHQAAAAAEVPLQVINGGDRLLIDEEVGVRVLHPAVGETFEEDNAGSLVMEIEYAGRRILLTGDLEGEGLRRLLTRDRDGEDLRHPQWPSDVLLSPHHGSRKANTPQLVRWARPKFVIVSADRRLKRSDLEKTYARGSQSLYTGENGAVTIEIRPEGQLTVHQMRESRHEN